MNATTTRNCMMMNLISYISLFSQGTWKKFCKEFRREDKKWHYLSFGRTNESGISYKLPKGIQKAVHRPSRPYSLSGCDSLYIRERAYRVVSALLLAALGVNEDVIMEDYRLSNDYFNIPKASQYAYKLSVNSQEAITTIYSAKKISRTLPKNRLRLNTGAYRPIWKRESDFLQKKLNSYAASY